jgi:hypothetical protein
MGNIRLVKTYCVAFDLNFIDNSRPTTVTVANVRAKDAIEAIKIARETLANATPDTFEIVEEVTLTNPVPITQD